MNTAVTIVGTLSRTAVTLAFIGAGLKLLLAVAPRFQIGAPKAPQVQVRLEPETPPAPVAGPDPAPVPLERAS